MHSTAATPLIIIVLAAGQGKRMRSQLPKVLHTLAHKPLINHVLETAIQLNPDALQIIYGHGGEQLQTALTAYPHPLQWIEQTQQLGTGHAVAQAIPYLPDNARILILYGDVPLISLTTLQKLIQTEQTNSIALLTVILENPHGYGRIVRDAEGKIREIVEHKDATPEQLSIHEVNTGILSIPVNYLKAGLAQLNPQNAQGEYYLTDIIGWAVQHKISVETIKTSNTYEVMGINDRIQLAELERYYQHQQAHALMQSGVTLRDPNRLDIRGIVESGQDTEIDINVILEGTVKLGQRVKIGANVIIKNAQIADEVEILPFSHIENAIIGARCRIGPYARIRPETVLAEDVHIGNFVELKKSHIDNASKINHLSYIGDSKIGKNVNIGAGTITCNYDGVNKHLTTIEDNAFIGSNTSLVAPLTIGAGATIGAGSTITQDTPPQQLTLSRSTQTTLPHWQRPQRKK